ncbi:MAG: LemA family protein, partial [Patescibacteria group bacterium]
MNFIYISAGIAALIVLWGIVSYNRFIAFINRTKEAWADIDVQLKRRYDLIPNLVNSVK